MLTLFLEPIEYNWTEGIIYLLGSFIVFSIITFMIGFTFSLIGYFFYSLSFEASQAKENRRLNKYILSPDQLAFLQANFSYYNHLPTQELKELFAKKVARFSSVKKFIPQDSLTEISPEMKTLIAAYATQIAFGWPHIYLAHFRQIFVFPDVYFSNINLTYHKGEVNTRGAIVFAWKELLKELDSPGDGRNLGIHEMSHALYLENMIKNNEFGFISQRYIDQLMDSFHTESKMEQDLFRAYAFNNIIEFFAVISEVFFEKGDLLMEKKPMLYQLFTKIYNQDPELGIYPLEVYRGTSLGDYLDEIFGLKKWNWKFKK